MEGVTKAALKHKESRRFGFINPQDGKYADAFETIPISNVTFDVAVTVESSSGKKKHGGLNVKVLEASLGNEDSKRTLGESRVSFVIPVCLPTTKLF